MGIETLDELIIYVRECLPNSKKPVQFQKNEEQGFINFHWEGKELLVRKNLQAVEMRGNQLFITGASMLLSTVLTKRNKHTKVLEAVLDVVKEAEHILGTQKQLDVGLKLLGTVKHSISKLAGMKSLPPTLGSASKSAPVKVPQSEPKKLIDKTV